MTTSASPTWPEHLKARFEQDAPRKILSLDGGGIRGLLTLAVLAEMERQIKEATGIELLCDYFDFIGGTSTGSIIAAGLAIGMSVAELMEFYEASGRQMFEKTALMERISTLLSSRYQREPLADKLREIFHDGTEGGVATLGSSRLRCLLLVVTRNMTTDSPWPISSNPFAKYNDPSRPDCNLQIPLWQLIRASTAAPVYFPPEVIQWDGNDPKKTFVFVDGGITPYNNPAFLLYRMATQSAYRLNWKTGERNLLIASVGTGSAPATTQATSRNVFGNLANLPGELMNGIEAEQDINCRIFGRCVHGAEVDREIGGLVLSEEEEEDAAGDHSRFFRYVRYNADLSEEGLAKLGLPEIPAGEVQKMDAVDQMENLRQIGKNVSDREVNLKKHFGPFLCRP